MTSTLFNVPGLDEFGEFRARTPHHILLRLIDVQPFQDNPAGHDSRAGILLKNTLAMYNDVLYIVVKDYTKQIQPI